MEMRLNGACVRVQLCKVQILSYKSFLVSEYIRSFGISFKICSSPIILVAHIYVGTPIIELCSAPIVLSEYPLVAIIRYFVFKRNV